MKKVSKSVTPPHPNNQLNWNPFFLPLCLKLDIHQTMPLLLGKGKEEIQNWINKHKS